MYQNGRWSYLIIWKEFKSLLFGKQRIVVYVLCMTGRCCCRMYIQSSPQT